MTRRRSRQPRTTETPTTPARSRAGSSETPLASSSFSGFFGAGEPEAVRWGERLRWLALLLTTALVCTRLYWPGENAQEGYGLGWVLALLLTSLLAVAAAWVGGQFRWRASAADLALLVLIILIAFSVPLSSDRRAAISMFWQWVGLGLAYFLVRWLPRDQREIKAFLLALAATAVALAVYGFYQVAVEDPDLRARYLQNPVEMLAMAGVGNDPVSRQMFENRLLNSREMRSTMALANSLAGILVGPCVMVLGVWLGLLLRQGSKPRKLVPLLLALPPLVLMLVALLLTKSRSAWLGFGVGLVLVALSLARRVHRRHLLIAGLGLLALLSALTFAAFKTRQLDREVLTESTKSLQYRVEYWQGTWSLLSESSRNFWRGVGPGNFGARYLAHKLPASSEEIADPHNLLLDVWASSGLPALLAIMAAFAFALWNAFRPSQDPRPADLQEAPPLPAPSSLTLVWLSGGVAWLLVLLIGDLEIFAVDGLSRWLVLGLGWSLGTILLFPLRRQTTPAAWQTAAAACAIIVNLLAAGGIAMPPVAIVLWVLLALAQNLREDQPGGKLRARNGRWTPFYFALLLAALLGTFAGTVVPHWRSRQAIEQGLAALDARRRDVDSARQSYLRSANLDPLSSEPWILLADLELRDWLARQDTPLGNVWTKVATALDQAVTPPRSRRQLRVYRQRAQITRMLLNHPALTSAQLRKELRQDLLRTSARAVEIYPNNAPLRADLADAAAEAGDFDLAARQAEQALRLHGQTPHLDKQLPADRKTRLESQLLQWKQQFTSQNPPDEDPL